MIKVQAELPGARSRTALNERLNLLLNLGNKRGIDVQNLLSPYQPDQAPADD
jgi:hypothetical protein